MARARFGIRSGVATLLALALASSSARALEPVLDDFLRESAGADEREFAALIERVNPYQLPLVAVAINAEERESGQLTNAYEALTRWHFWLTSRLDQEGRGLWALHGFGSVAAESRPRRESAIIAALQQLQLRALTEMAVRRGRMVDALAWVREARIVQRQMVLRLYDPIFGAYVDVDSLGTRIPGSADLRSLIAIGLGAPALRVSGDELATRVLAGDAGDAMELDARLMLELDPQSGWWRAAGSSELGPTTAGFFLYRGLKLMRAEDSASAVENALRLYGIDPLDARPSLGPLTISLPESALRQPAFTASEAALGFLACEGLVPRDHAADLAQRIAGYRSGESPGDSLATPLLRAISRWKQSELDAQHATFLRAGENPLPPANGRGAGAFRYTTVDRDLWTRQALDTLTEDLLGLYLQSQQDAAYRAQIEPLAVAMGTRPQLTLRRLSQLPDPDWPGSGWRVAWTDGKFIRPSEAIHFTEADAFGAGATLPAPPEEKGLWWLVLSGPKGLPREAVGVSVVDPLFAEILPDGAPAPDGTQRLRISLTNYTRARLTGRTECELPPNWRATPSPSMPFALEPGQMSVTRMLVSPDEAAQAGQYPMRVRFLVNGRKLQENRIELAIPYQWITLGGFRVRGEQGLATRTPGDASLDLSARYELPGGKRGWEHLQADAVEPGGWIELATESDAPGIYFARTVLSSASREVVLHFEASSSAELRLNGARIAAADPLSGVVRGETVFDYGANHLQVKMLGGGGSPARFKLSIRDIEGGPLLSVENRLERLLDGYAYVRGAAAQGGRDLDEGDRYVLVPIVYQSRGVGSVAVVGSFNGWSPTATPMVDLGGGRWKAEIRLPLGRFEYKLAVDGVRWIADPSNPVAVPDGFGGRNSVLVLE